MGENNKINDDRPVCVGDRYEVEISEIVETEKGGEIYHVKGFNSLILTKYVLDRLKRIDDKADPAETDDSDDCPGLENPFPKPDVMFSDKCIGSIVRVTDEGDDAEHKMVRYGILMSGQWNAAIKAYDLRIMFNDGHWDYILGGSYGKAFGYNTTIEITPFHTNAVNEVYKYLDEFNKAVEYIEKQSD